MIRTFFSHGCNAALVLLAAAWLVLLIAGLPAHSGLAVLGAATFLAGEYGFHRFILHAPPARPGTRMRQLQQGLHLDHHAHPGRLDLLFLPSWFLVGNLALAASFGALIWRDAGRIAAFVAGIVAAMLHYEWTHFVAHVAYRPRTAWGRWMKRNHLIHHFRDGRKDFGVTHPALDLLLGTYAAPDATSRGAERT